MRVARCLAALLGRAVKAAACSFCSSEEALLLLKKKKKNSSRMQRHANDRTGAVGFVFTEFVPSRCRATEGNSGSVTPGDPVVCEADDSFRCGVALDDQAAFDTLVSVSVSGSVAPNVLLKVPARPGE